jgi:acetyltransferase-like isoleucine patch superfamily enzyme
MLLVLFFRVAPHWVVNLLFNASSSYGGVLAVAIRYVLIKAKARSVGHNLYIGRYCTLKNISNLDLGSDVSIHDGCYIDAVGGVVIKDLVSIAHHSSILSFEHKFQRSDIPIKYQGLTLAPVFINRDVWIGCGVRILAGAAIASATVVGANSIVKNSIGPGLYAGCPAKKIRDIS